jgi:hypothetical protein
LISITNSDAKDAKTASSDYVTNAQDNKLQKLLIIKQLLYKQQKFIVLFLNLQTKLKMVTFFQGRQRNRTIIQAASIISMIPSKHRKMKFLK